MTVAAFAPGPVAVAMPDDFARAALVIGARMMAAPVRHGLQFWLELLGQHAAPPLAAPAQAAAAPVFAAYHSASGFASVQVIAGAVR